jgi:hypothetical protein
MANQLFINDRTNPVLLPARPVSGGDINWDSQPGQPGVSPIFADLTAELQKLYIETDATIVGKGIKENNIANLAVLPQNQREIINRPYRNRLITIQAATPGTYYIQVDGQPLVKKELFKFQAITNYRNFQNGVDNITTEIDIQMNNAFLQSGGLNTPLQFGTTWYLQPDGLSNADDYKNVKIYVEVDSTSAFSSPVVIAKESFYGYTNYTSQEQPQWKIEVEDKVLKSYQNPWYRVSLALEKSPNQAAGVSMQILLQTMVSCKYKCKNKHI